VIRLFLLAFALLGGPSVAHAADGVNSPLVQGPKGAKSKKPPGKRVNVQILVVHATPGNPHMDPALRRWARQMSHLRYDNFKVLERYAADLVPERPKSFTVSGGRVVTVTLLKRDPQRARLRIQMYRKNQKLVDTTVAVARDGTFIVAGPRHGEGILVLPITASY
jgi:hypothetical protein